MADTILIVEDDAKIAELLTMHLSEMGFDLVHAKDGLEGVEKFQKRDYALVILDIMLPKLDGFEVAKEIRTRNRHTPILMLTSKSEELDKVLGLELGADDYLTKPFSIRELLARVKAIFRRIRADQEIASKEDTAIELNFGELQISREKHRVEVGGLRVDLTSKEFDLLVQLASNPGRVYTRQELLDLVWGYRFSGYEHTVNSHINRLRSKIEKNPSKPEYIKTVWGVGYSFAEREDRP
jgi:DNA-binding response OmpR family regulator